MATTESDGSAEVAEATRRIEDAEDGYVVVVHVDAHVEVPLVVRVVDAFPVHPSVTEFRIDAADEPARWTLDDGRLVFEDVVPAGSRYTLRYRVRASSLEQEEGNPEVRVAQPMESGSPREPGTVPQFRDSLTMERGPVGQFVQPTAPGAGDGAGQSVDREASDDEVRQAIEAISLPVSCDEPAATHPRIDLADPGEE